MIASLINILLLAAQAEKPVSLPKLADYPVKEVFTGQAKQPILTSVVQRAFRSRIRNGVSKGEGVWNGSWDNPTLTAKPNFAGHYFVIRWGCGSNCLMMAIVDAETGKVFNPPLNIGELGLQMDLMSKQEIDFEPTSSLMILRNACKAGRSECGIYYFNWETDRFRLVKRILVDLTRQ